ncbi:MAG: hypothetical protein SynsKO_44250 [Synoicihabitans sp.]
MKRKTGRSLSLVAGLLAMMGAGCQSEPKVSPKFQAALESTISLSPMGVVAETSPQIPTSAEFPMKLIGGLVVVQADDEGGPWNFLIDTGSSATLVSPEFAIRRRSRRANPSAPTVWLRDATGQAVPVDSVLLDKVDFGPAHFSNVRALVFDCRVISDHLGIKIDGVLGFNLFADARLTLDYPGRRIVMSELDDQKPLRGCVIPFTVQNGVPLITVNLGSEPVLALIDSGSDGSMSLDPAGMELNFLEPPRQGTMIGTLHGNHRQILGRLADTLHISEFQVETPVVDLSGNLTSLGGEILQNFEVTFDQSSREVAFYHRDDAFMISSPPKMSSGLSFTKVQAYWRVTAVAPDSPAESAGFSLGDLVIRIEGEPVDAWDLNRYNELVNAGGTIEYTLIKGRDEVVVSTDSFALVP